jgi:hypothetical protein
MPDANLIKAKLGSLRKRQFLQLWLDSSVIAFLVFVFWMLACKLRFFPALSRLSGTIHYAAIAIFLIAALIVAIRRMPSWKESVKLVDRELGLQQRLETCWENMPPQDEIGSLLVADVSKRIARLQPASITPMRLSRASMLCVFILLPAIALSGILRAFLDWNNRGAESGKTASIRTASGSSPAKKGSPKAPAKNRSNDLKSQAYVAAESNSEKHQPEKEAENRPSAGIPEQFGIRESKGPANAAPDSSVAAKKNIAVNSGDKQDVMQPNAGAASIRKAEKGGGASANALLSPDSKASGKTIPAGQGQGSLTKKDAAFQNEYMQNYPAVWSAAEQALAKENIPPGMKKYIIDYFNAIH